MPRLTASATPLTGTDYMEPVEVEGDGIHETLRLLADALIENDYLHESHEWDVKVTKP